MVFEMAPVMNGCDAAIMRMCPSGMIKRVLSGPQRFAQSNTARCSDLRCGAPSTVCVPQTVRLIVSICLRVRPSARRPLNDMSFFAAAASMPAAVRTLSGIDHAENANAISNTVGSEFSTARSCSWV